MTIAVLLFLTEGLYCPLHTSNDDHDSWGLTSQNNDRFVFELVGDQSYRGRNNRVRPIVAVRGNEKPGLPDFQSRTLPPDLTRPLTYNEENKGLSIEHILAATCPAWKFASLASSSY